MISVRRMADSASGSVMAAMKPCNPVWKASRKTTTSGRKTNKPKNVSATMMSAMRTPTVSPVAAGVRTVAGCSASTAIAESPAAPRLDHIDDEQHREGNRQHHSRDDGRAGVVELLQPDHDQQRRDLGHERDVAGNEDDRSVFADGTCERKRSEERRVGKAG